MGFFRQGKHPASSRSMERRGVDPHSLDPLQSLGSVIPGGDANAPRTNSFTRQIRFLILLPAAALALAIAALGGMLVYYTIAFPNPLEARQRDAAPIVRILARDGSVLAERGDAQEYMPLSLLPKRVTDAVVATEDRRFYRHWGIDPEGMGRAMFANLRAGRYVEGGSTLTQQLAKNMFLSPERTLSRKLEEFALAVWLEVRLSKDDILELYLNRVYFGSGAYGIEAAAQRYFSKSARELSLAEAAVIAGLLKAPSKYSPASSPDQAVTRGRAVLSKMLSADVISLEDYRRAMLENVKFSQAKRAKDENGTDYAVEFVLERLPPLAGSGHSEVVVETTIDPDLQKRASRIVANELNANGSALQASQAAVVVLDLDGGIRAMVGGKSYAESQYNRAVKAQRQPGSAFKPILYLSAIEAGYTPDSLVYDTPMTIGNWTPRNDNGKYLGAVTLRQALALSINAVAARLFAELGSSTVIATARRLGITTPLRQDPSLALGTSEVGLTELTGAYAVLANGGRAVEPHCIRRVRMSSGRVLYAREPTEAQVVAPAHVAAMNDMLRAGMTWGTGRRAALPGHMAGGKTGTTQDFRDAWFVGYSAHFAGGVWVGNDNGRPMNKVMGGSLPASIWQQIMVVAHQGRASLPLPGIELGAPPSVSGDVIASSNSPGFEDLPWLHEADATPHAFPPRAGSISVRAPASHPAEAIDPHLIERILAEPSADRGTLEATDQSIKKPTRADVNGRIVVEPPSERMSLGASAN